jgi:hypothetical protein
VHATFEDWTHLERSHLAFEAYLRRTKGTHGPSVAAGAYGEGPGKYPSELTLAVELWVDNRGRFREERADHKLTLVSDGERSVIYSPESGPIEHESQGVRPSADALLDPGVLIPGLELAQTGESSVAGRRALVIDAMLRLPVMPPTDIVPYGCDAVTLHVDLERGVVLRVEARFEREPVKRLELTSIVFDEAFPDTLFELELPEGETVRPASEVYASRNVTLEDAAHSAAFTVWWPPDLPSRWQLHVVHRPESERPHLTESVTLLFSDRESLHHFGIEQAAEHLLAWRVGNETVIEEAGIELRLVGGDVLPGPPLEIHLERDGTHVRVYSDNLDQARLIEIATSLAPAPTELPPVSGVG